MRRTRFVSPPLNAGLFVNPEGPYPKPSISVSPAGVIPVGGNVTIRCWQHHYPGLRIQLYRDGIWNYLNYMDPAGSEAEFPIPSVSREHGGSYQCRYSDISGTYSEPSDPVEIIVADPGLPRPAISLRPSSVPAPGANVTIRCEGPGRAVRFFLHKAGDLNLQEHVDPAGDWTEFRIPDVGRHHGGRYSCSYRPRSQPFVSSEPSDPMELLVAGEGPNSASRLPAPHADNRTPWGGDCSPVGRPEPGSVLTLAGSVAEFPIPSVSREHGGSYRCLYTHRPGNYSEPCDPVEIIVADPGLPRPAISLHPSSVPAPGANVTIRCEGAALRQHVRFFLHKAGDMNTQEHVDPAGDWAEFRIPDVGRHHGGRYSCSYRPRLQPFVSSEPSDPVELLVAGEGPNSASRLPAPHADNRTPWGGDCSSVGCPEPGSVLSPRAQQRDTRPGNRDGVTGGEEGTRGTLGTPSTWMSSPASEGGEISPLETGMGGGKDLCLVSPWWPGPRGNPPPSLPLTEGSAISSMCARSRMQADLEWHMAPSAISPKLLLLPLKASLWAASLRGMPGDPPPAPAEGAPTEGWGRGPGTGVGKGC
uniref:Ig-like domain-containing protein n=1 Tax=Pelusios castaneus TaxID=367368 RepID=A0A8C8SGE7_9SAUR